MRARTKWKNDDFPVSFRFIIFAYDTLCSAIRLFGSARTDAVIVAVRMMMMRWCVVYLKMCGSLVQLCRPTRRGKNRQNLKVKTRQKGHRIHDTQKIFCRQMRERATEKNDDETIIKPGKNGQIGYIILRPHRYTHTHTNIHPILCVSLAASDNQLGWFVAVLAHVCGKNSTVELDLYFTVYKWSHSGWKKKHETAQTASEKKWKEKGLLSLLIESR